MRKRLLLYFPPLILAVISLFLPMTGPDRIGGMSWREFIHFLAICLTLLAVGVHLVLWAILTDKHSNTARGFEVHLRRDNEDANRPAAK